MRANRHRLTTRTLLVLAVVLASVWIGGHTAPAAGQPVGHLTAGAAPAGIEPVVLRDHFPVLGGPETRSGRSGHLLPVLAGMLVAALAVAGRRCPRGPRPGVARARSLARRTHLEARAPPFLQPA